jgi:hypothetical protein
VSRFDAQLIPEHFEVDVQGPVVIRCAHWGRCWWSTDFDGDDVRPIRDLLEAARKHIDDAHPAEKPEGSDR